MLQGPTYRFSSIAVEAGKAGPEQLSVAFGNDRLCKRIGVGEQAAGLAARRVDALPRFVLAFQRADLNDPAGADGERPDGAALLNGLWLRRGIGISQRRRAGGGGGQAGGWQDAKQTIAGAMVRRLRRHPLNVILVGIGLDGLRLGHDCA